MSPLLFFVHDTLRLLDPLVCEKVCTPLAYDEFAVRAPDTPAVETRVVSEYPSEVLKLTWLPFRSTTEVGCPARLKCLVALVAHPFSVYSWVVLLSTFVRVCWRPAGVVYVPTAVPG